MVFFLVQALKIQSYCLTSFFSCLWPKWTYYHYFVRQEINCLLCRRWKCLCLASFSAQPGEGNSCKTIARWIIVETDLIVHEILMQTYFMLWCSWSPWGEDLTLVCFLALILCPADPGFCKLSTVFILFQRGAIQNHHSFSQRLLGGKWTLSDLLEGSDRNFLHACPCLAGSG